MIKKIKNSFAFRSSLIYKFFLSFTSVRKNRKSNPTTFKMITLCGSAHLPFLRESLYSIYKNFKSIPQIEIYSDGSISITDIERSLKDFSEIIKVLMWDECLHQIANDEVKLIEFAQKHPIGKKLLVLTANAKYMPTLWWDTDILWFKDISQLGLPSFNDSFNIKTTEDFQLAYSKNMLKYFENSYKKPYVNTGIVYLHGFLFQHLDLFDMLNTAADNPNHFSEQTILAKAVELTRSQTWDLNLISCRQSDQNTIKATFLNQPWVARHYIGPVRHLFWRDAFFLKINL